MKKVIRKIKLKNKRKIKVFLVPPKVEFVLDEKFDYAGYVDDLIAYKTGEFQGFFENSEEEYDEFLENFLKEKEEYSKIDKGYINDICGLQYIYEVEANSAGNNEEYKDYLNKYITLNMQLLAKHYKEQKDYNQNNNLKIKVKKVSKN